MSQLDEECSQNQSGDRARRTKAVTTRQPAVNAKCCEHLLYVTVTPSLLVQKKKTPAFTFHHHGFSLIVHFCNYKQQTAE